MKPIWILEKIKDLPLKGQVELLKRKRLGKALKVLQNLRSPLLTLHFLKAQPEALNRISFLHLLEREEDLRYFASQDSSPLVRFKALSLIPSEVRRMEILLSEKDPSNLELALESLLHHSEYRLALINHHKDEPGIGAFISRSTDTSLHIKIACFCIDRELREMSFEKLNISQLGDESKLALLRVTVKKEHIARIVETLDVNTLCEIVKGGNSRIIREIEVYAQLQNIPQIQKITQRSL